MIETIKSKAYRVSTDSETDSWDKISFWTKASDVVFEDGGSAEDALGSIAGITDSLNGDNSNIAASAKALSQLNAEVQALKKSVSDGKAKVAAAITAKGTATEPDASFDTMAANINGLASGGSVVTLGTFKCDYENIGSIYVTDTSGNAREAKNYRAKTPTTLVTVPDTIYTGKSISANSFVYMYVGGWTAYQDSDGWYSNSAYCYLGGSIGGGIYTAAELGVTYDPVEHTLTIPASTVKLSETSGCGYTVLYADVR